MGRVWLLSQPFVLVLGLRLQLVATLGGLPVGFAVTDVKADERRTLLGILAADSALEPGRPGQVLIADRQHYGAEFEAALVARRLRPLRSALIR
jgi:hypothetical protein